MGHELHVIIETSSMKKGEAAGLIKLIKKQLGVSDSQLHTGDYYSNPETQTNEENGLLACERRISIFIPYSGTIPAAQEAFTVFQKVAQAIGILGYECSVIKLNQL